MPHISNAVATRPRFASSSLAARRTSLASNATRPSLRLARARFTRTAERRNFPSSEWTRTSGPNSSAIPPGVYSRVTLVLVVGVTQGVSGSAQMWYHLRFPQAEEERDPSQVTYAATECLRTQVRLQVALSVASSATVTSVTLAASFSSAATRSKIKRAMFSPVGAIRPFRNSGTSSLMRFP